MTDVHSKEVRSYNMSRIKGKDTKPELIVRKYLFANGFRYRLNVKKLPGKPDIVLPKYRTVIFVHGCFWHGHDNCKRFKLPKSGIRYWKKKISGNKIRDAINIQSLLALNWKIVVIWECKIKDEAILNKLIKNIGKSKKQIQIY